MAKRFEQVGLRVYALATLGASMLLACVLILEQTVHAEVPAGLPLEQSANSTPAPGCELAWRVVPSPNFTPTDRALWDIEVISSQDIWAVGRRGTMHWNGIEWSIVPVPGAPILNSVAAIASNDIWAVGNSDTGTAILHWDGFEWSAVPHPSGGSLNSVTAIASDDVWIVGFYGQNYFTRTLHWNGSTWSLVLSPDPGVYNYLTSVTALSTNDVWAIGYTYTPSMGHHTLAMHWDGANWTVIPTPNTESRDNFLHGVSATSTTDIWAVGKSYTPGQPYRTLVQHWNGSEWTIVPSPDFGTMSNHLYAVVALSPNDAWAVGSAESTDPYTGEPIDVTLALHWNGSMWTIIPSANPGTGFNEFLGVDAVSTTEIWAVGYYSNPSESSNTLVERYHQICQTPTPPATATTQPPTNTSTATSVPTSTPSNTFAPTSTAISTATLTATNTSLPTSTPTTTLPAHTPTTTPACTLSFSDVPSNNVFHPFIQCLACRDILSGYADGTFRPNNEVTRGQLSKIVANSAGFDETPSGSTFQDALPGSAFYLFVERMATRGVIGGYLCGGPEEPCISPDNRPYFRPNANATRGQISKIVANAASLSDPPGEQNFEDVQPGSAFYDFVQRLSSREIMSGYPCGGVTEPCGESSRPYFRPNAKATRGQTAKIVGNTYFLNCPTPFALLTN